MYISGVSVNSGVVSLVTKVRMDNLQESRWIEDEGEVSVQDEATVCACVCRSELLSSTLPARRRDPASVSSGRRRLGLVVVVLGVGPGHDDLLHRGQLLELLDVAYGL